MIPFRRAPGPRGVPARLPLHPRRGAAGRQVHHARPGARALEDRLHRPQPRGACVRTWVVCAPHHTDRSIWTSLHPPPPTHPDHPNPTRTRHVQGALATLMTHELDRVFPFLAPQGRLHMYSYGACLPSWLISSSLYDPIQVSQPSISHPNPPNNTHTWHDAQAPRAWATRRSARTSTAASGTSASAW